MKNFWQWFLAHGDKLLTSLTTIALTPAVSAMLPSYVPLTLAALSTAHIIALPEPTQPAAGVAISAKALLPFALLLLGLGTIGGLTACKSMPTANQQAGIAVAIDIATGLAVQQGSQNPAVWKARAAQFSAAAKAIKAVADQGPTSLQTLAADLQPYIAKLGPADVLAANALVAALTPYIQAQLQANPSAANLQATIDLIATDVINACTAYGV